MTAMLEVRNLQKIYRKGRLDRTPTFHLSADFTIERPAVVGMMGPNGSNW
jgi:ABC-type multidrug transport system ATPase subunit